MVATAKNLVKLNLTQLPGGDQIHPTVRENFNYMQDWADNISAHFQKQITSLRKIVSPPASAPSKAVTEAAGTFYAGPVAGAPTTPDFRPIASSDLIEALLTPPAIGGQTPNAGSFTALLANNLVVNDDAIIGGALIGDEILTVAADPDQYFKIATLPISSATNPISYDHMLLQVSGSDNLTSADVNAIKAVFGNRGVFHYAWEYSLGINGTPAANWGVRAYTNALGTTDIYVYTKTGQTISAAYTVPESINVTLFQNTPVTLTPSGTLVFDSLDPVTYPPSGIVSTPELANFFYAGPPNGASAPPTFRAQVDIDVPIGARTLRAKAAATANVASLSGTTTQDGISLIAGDIVFLPLQSTATQNGLWQIASGAWVRPVNFLAGLHAQDIQIEVQQGTTLKGTYWTCLSVAPTDVVGTNNLVFQEQGTVTGITFTGSPLSPIYSIGFSAPSNGVVTFSAALLLQTANTFFAAPNGVTGTPGFRTIVGTDLPLATTSLFGAVKPDGTTTTISAGVISAVGAGSVTSFSAGNLSPLFTTSVATATTTPALTFALNTQSANTFFRGPTSGGAATPTWGTLVAADVSGVAVTSVALALPASTFSISGSPVTSTGTLTGAFISQSSNAFFAAPSSSTGVPGWRSIAVLDLPSLIIAAGSGAPLSGPQTGGILFNNAIPANMVGATGRVLRARYVITFTGISATTTFITLTLNGQPLAGGVAGFPSGTTANWIEFDITRSGTTTGSSGSMSQISPVPGVGTFTLVGGGPLSGLNWTASQTLLLTVTCPSGVTATGQNAVIQLL